MLRDRDIKWVTNAKVDRIAADAVEVTEIGEDGEPKRQHRLPSKMTMFIPAFRGVTCVMGEDGKGLPGLANPRGFVLIDKHQRNPTFKNIFAVGVCVAIPPYEQTPVPVGVPKTGYMIESMVSAVAENIRDLHRGPRAATGADMERRLPCRFRQWRCRFRCSAANPAAQCQLGRPRLLGPFGESRV